MMSQDQSTPWCQWTRANGSQPPGQNWSNPHGNGILWTYLPRNGTLVAQRQPNGALRARLMWWRGINGWLAINASRLGASAGRFRVRIPRGYGMTGLQPAELYFDSPGCWEVTGSLEDNTLSIIVLICEG